MKQILLGMLACAVAIAQAQTPTKTGTAPTKTGTTPTKTGTTTAKAPAKAVGCNVLSPDTCKATAPATFKAKLVTTQGDVVIEVHRDWAPQGADRFYNLVRSGFFTDAPIFRVIPGFMAQFGVSARPEVSKVWRDTNLRDDPVKQSNKKGMLSFASAGPNTRTTQLFINYGDNARLDGMGFSPFGEVTEGMDVVEKWFSGYNAQFGGDSGELQGPIGQQGIAFVNSKFPKLDRIKTASIVPATPAAPAATKAGDTTKAPAATKAPAKTDTTKKQ
jgi:peptidyl-prolyl cis-trans isomerase A (cyclophilin A)